MEQCNILRIKNHLRLRMSRTKNDMETIGYDNEKKYLKELIKRCTAHAESESVLIIGPRGCGKTKLLNNTMEEVRNETNTEFRIVHLNGFLLTDDKIALHEIARQLKLDASSFRNFGSFQESLIFLLGSSFTGPEKIPLLFILDEFDAFLQHKNQTLLYNLLDTMNNFDASICIIGLTSRMDVTELFEKRVKSRFSHRQIQLCLNINFDQYKNVFVSLLKLSNKDFSKDFVENWNRHVQNLCEEPSILEILKKLYSFDNSLQTLQMFLVYPIAQLSKLKTQLEVADFIFSYKSSHASNSKSNMIQGLSVLELSLIVATANLKSRYYEDAFNFEMIYNEYKNFCERKSLNLAQEKPVIFKAFENLIDLELICPVDSTNEKIKKDYWLMMTTVHLSELVESIARVPNCPTQIKQWVFSESSFDV